MKSSKGLEETAEVLRWLAEHGSPVVIPEARPTLRVEQISGDNVTRVLDLEDGRACYILDLAVTNLSSKQCFITDSHFYMPWFDSNFAWLHDPRNGLSGYPPYRLQRSLYFERNSVLNHIVFSGGGLKPNIRYAGLLLGIGDPMPPNIVHGFSVRGTLALAINGPPLEFEIQIRAERMFKISHKLNTRPAAYEGLYGSKIRSGVFPGSGRDSNRPPSPTVSDIVDMDCATKRRQ